MITAENKNFFRIILLLYDAASFILRQIIARELENHGGDLDTLLKKDEFEGQLKHKLHFGKSQLEKLFPSNGKTDIKTWDSKMLADVSILIFRSTLSSNEKFYINYIKLARKRVSDKATASYSDDEFVDEKDGIVKAIDSLASSFDTTVQESCKNLIVSYCSDPLDRHEKKIRESQATVLNFLNEPCLDIGNVELQVAESKQNSSLEQKQAKQGNSSLTHHIAKEAVKVSQKVDTYSSSFLEEVQRNQTEHAAKLEAKLEELKHLFEQTSRVSDHRSKIIKFGTHTHLTADGPTQEWINIVETVLKSVFDLLLNKVEDPGQHPEIERAVEEFLNFIKGFKGVEIKAVDRNCSLLHLEGSSIKHESKKGIAPSFECTSIYGLDAFWRLFVKGEATPYIDRIAATVSSEVKEKTSLSTNVNLQEFEDALSCFEATVNNEKENVLLKTKDKKTQKSSDVEIDTTETRSEGLWETCILLKCRKYGYRALRKQEYPDQRTLNKLSKKFGKKDKLTLKVCDKICSLIRSKDDSIVDVCATVREGNDNIVFVIIVNKNLRLEKLIEYSFVKRILNEVSNEGKEVINNQNFDNIWTLTSNASRKKLRRCIHETNMELMKNHRYLTMISGSPVRSKGYNSQSHTIEREMCIVLYVLIKGYIPIQEEPFEKTYFEVPVDVREGCFVLFTRPANHFQDSLKIGCQIQREELGTGTLGGFIDYPEVGTCGITCAHVLLHEVELKNLAPTADDDMELGYSATGHNVYQPEYTPCHRNAFGKIVKAIFREGGGTESGIDIAVFKVEQRFPFLGEFPALNNGSRLNMSYDSGKVVDISRIVPGPVLKFGAQSNLTEGSFVTVESTNSVKTLKFADYEFKNPYQIKLHNLLEIRSSVRQSPFAEPGDSGALVFCKGENNELICIGVVEGGTSHGTCMVMPISPILEQLNVTTLKSFETNKQIEQRMEEKLSELRNSISNEIFASEMRTAQREEQRYIDMQNTFTSRTSQTEDQMKKFMESIVSQSEQRVLDFLKNTKSQPQ